MTTQEIEINGKKLKSWVATSAPELFALATALLCRNSKKEAEIRVTVPLLPIEGKGEHGHTILTIKTLSQNSLGAIGFMGRADVFSGSGAIEGLDIAVIGWFSRELNTGRIEQLSDEVFPGQFSRYLL